jgi:endonuclease/exonuclease/phosphatase family metal-dependent hydrolase
MKTIKFPGKIYFKTGWLIFITGILCFVICLCDPLVNQFKETEEADLYTARHKIVAPQQIDTLMVMTWNIRFGAGRLPWFGDSCGDIVIFSNDQILQHLSGIAAKINEIQPDILLIQEIDIQSKRTGYINEVQWLLDHTYFNYAAYASMWEAQYIPSDGLGRINTGQAILSRWKITDSERIQLPLRGDQDALTKYFYLRRCILKAEIRLPGDKTICVLDPHLDAFSTDDTKKKQIDYVKKEIDDLSSTGHSVILGGDFNLIPPGSDSTDFCMEDKCPGESFHGPHDNPRHKEGSYFTPEVDWLQVLMDQYPCCIPQEKYLKNQASYFTHSPKRNAAWDRRIDYLFTNEKWVADSDMTYQNITDLSDHVPVSAKWEVPR